jgi:hypothetical protein
LAYYQYPFPLLVQYSSSRVQPVTYESPPRIVGHNNNNAVNKKGTRMREATDKAAKAKRRYTI